MTAVIILAMLPLERRTTETEASAETSQDEKETTQEHKTRSQSSSKRHNKSRLTKNNLV